MFREEENRVQRLIGEATAAQIPRREIPNNFDTLLEIRKTLQRRLLLLVNGEGVTGESHTLGGLRVGEPAA
jgi:hypothetical protein